MNRTATAILAFFYASICSGANLADIRCGTNTVGELLKKGWELAEAEYIESISRDGDYITLTNGNIYKADMTSGMFAGDSALLLRKFVQTPKQRGFIHNICAGGFDAWVRRVK